MKPYKIDFSFLYPSEASMYVCAASEDEAAEGAMTILGEDYTGLKITGVQEVKKEKETIN